MVQLCKKEKMTVVHAVLLHAVDVSITYLFQFVQTIVCEVCGDIGYKKLLIYCRGCEDSASHQYCFNKVVYDGSLADWLCLHCQQRSGEVTCRGSLEVSSERPSHARSETSKNDYDEDQQPIPLTNNFVDDCNVMDGLTPEKEKQVVRFQLDYRATDELQHRSIAVNVTQQATLQDDAMDNVMPCSPNMCILDKEDIENQNMPSEDIENQNQKENQSEPSNMFDRASLQTYPAKFLPEDISVDFGKDNPRKRRHLILDDDDDDHDEDKAEDVHLENVQSGDLSDSNGSNGGPVEKRRRYVDANEDEDEEADKVEETVQIGDLSYSDCSNGGPVKKRRRYVDANEDEDEDEEADKVEETVQIGDLSYSDCSNGGPVKKRRRYIDASEDENDDEEAVIDVANTSSAQNNVANGVLNDGTDLELQTAIPEEHPPRSRIPSDSDTADQQYYVHSRPIDEPIWRYVPFSFSSNDQYLLLVKNGDTFYFYVNSGDFKIKSDVFVVEAMKIPRWQAWPKRWKSATPTDDCIRPNEESKKLLNEIIESDDALKVSIGVIELLIFPSTLLSEQNQWQETSVVKHVVHVENEIMVERNCVAQNVAMEIAKRKGITLPDSKLSYAKPNSPEDGSKWSVHQRIDVDLHAPEEMNQQAPESNASNVTKSTTECGHGESHSGSRLPTTKLCGLVVARTPRAQQLLEEMISEGHAVPDAASEACLELFPVQQEKIGWAPRVEATKEVDLDLSLGVRSPAPSMKL
ncbi:hypothetical protein PR202_ga03953 [Eleusine coracana subsp. coracana]|uniref:AIPP2-like SPOC-like domain-containing protein n=1 Tax=Eleusine coracana subsp. coracana TaxID=191504 RepID=A0AAV5BNF2_ELECO|nr:hypothetical protein PR202_ga03953 [Eleusine coracana subsp. coracana]